LLSVVSFLLEYKWVVSFYVLVFLLIYIFRSKFDVKGVVALYRTNFMERTIQKTNPLVGEEIQITTKLVSDPEREATKIQFYDNYTTNIKITIIEGCEIIDNSVQWTGDLWQGQTKLCCYTIKPTTNISYTSTATAYYDNGDTTTSISNTATITTQK